MDQNLDHQSGLALGWINELKCKCPSCTSELSYWKITFRLKLYYMTCPNCRNDLVFEIRDGFISKFAKYVLGLIYCLMLFLSTLLLEARMKDILFHLAYLGFLCLPIHMFWALFVYKCGVLRIMNKEKF